MKHPTLNLTEQQKLSLRQQMMEDPEFLTGLKQGLQEINGLVVHMDTVITAITPQAPKEKFDFLALWFHRGTWMHSSTTRINQHPAVQLVVDMGEEAIPMILNDLGPNCPHWYGTLRRLTGAQPIPPEHAGYIQKIKEDWKQWGRANGYIP